MSISEKYKDLVCRFVVDGVATQSDYFALIREIITRKQNDGDEWQQYLDRAYDLVLDEIKNNRSNPTQQISFGTSGWRGKLGKDIFTRSVAAVTTAIVQMYKELENDLELSPLLGVKSLAEAQDRGCVLGYDNRFAGALFATIVASILQKEGFTVHYAGESTTGVLSAAVLELGAAFSINLTPSHNPLEYGGYKFNAADAGPAASAVTERITRNANILVNDGFISKLAEKYTQEQIAATGKIKEFDSFATWKNLVIKNKKNHGLDLEKILSDYSHHEDMVVAVDCVHGASRLHISELFSPGSNLIVLRDNTDVTFGGVAPEPSSMNMQNVVSLLHNRTEKFKLGAIIDPDGDRIRFTDGVAEISMNQFGAMAYHFLHEFKGKKGMVAKTVATSNLANCIADGLNEEIFEPGVGFKNFKKVIGKALVYFEESDGISIIGHTPEKDAYIGLLLALDMVMTTQMNLGAYLQEIENEYGAYYPDRDGVEVSVKGEELLSILARLDQYGQGTAVQVGVAPQKIKKVITIDGRKMIFEDGSWLMIRPSGTEPKVRFYVESRTSEGTKQLVTAAQKMLAEIGLL